MQKQPNSIPLGENTQLFFVMEKALWASFLEHICFIPLFFWLGIWEMAVLNIFSSTLLAFSLYLKRKNHVTPAYLITMSEVVVHAIAAVNFAGWNSGFHYYIIVLIPFIFFWPYWNFRIKIISSAFLFIIYSSLYLFSQTTGSIYHLELWQLNLTNIFNGFAAFSAFASVALYYQTSVNTAEIDLKIANARLEILARTDPLTDLQNRRTILEKMDEEENSHKTDMKQFSIIMSDIDHFKSFNDNYGHQFGDLVLVSMANLLKSATRSRDIVARWGGEEFLVLLPETSGEEAKEVAERMRIIISQTPLYVNDNEIYLSMTFGVAECTINAGINECIALADRALYQGKENGRNRVVLYVSESV